MEKRFFNALFVKGALFSALVAFFCAALLTCSNSAGGSDAPVSQKDSPLISSRPGYVILSGTVSASGAVPQILADTPDASDNSQNGLSRSAYPGIDASGADATMEYFATATCGSDVVNGTFGSGSEAKKFGIELAASKTWSVVVGVRSKTADAEGNKKIYLQSKPWSVTPDPADPTISRNFVPVPNTSDGEGKIELNVNCSASSNSLRVKFISGPDGVDLSEISAVVTNNTSNTGKIIKVENVKSGVYELCLDFLTIPENMLEYSSLQTVTVADGMTTNAWVDDANASALSPISGGEFKFNNDNKNALTAAFLGTTVFVGKVSSDSAEPDDSNSGNFLSPLKTITRAAERINAVGNGGLDYYIRVSGEVSGLSSKSAAVIQTLAADKAKSLTIIGTSGPDTDCIKSVTYQHSALNVTTPVPIKLKNIKIVGATGEGQGNAVSAWGSANVIIEDSVEITGADIGVEVSGSASVTMKGGTIAGNGVAVDVADGSFVVQGGSIPYDSANKKNYVKTASEKFVTAKGDLAAVDASSGKIAIEPAQKKRGVKLIDASAATASDDDIKAKFMVYDPTISAENPSGDEWQLVSAAADRALKTNAPIYVGKKPDGTTDGSNDNAGTKSAPFATIARACQDMDDAGIDYEINVRGTVSGAQTIPNTLSKDSTLLYHAKSVTIKGVTALADGVPQDAIDGGGSGGTALTVASAVPITIQNLKITGGADSQNGGGIYMNPGADVTILGGALITANKAKNHGGGIYCANGRLTIKGGKISANEITGSSDNRGGIGLYATGDSVIEMTGGEISGNKDTSHVDVVGGGVKLEGSASFKMSGGEVKDNQVVRLGGNFYVTGGGDSGPSVTLSGSAKITGGVADSSSTSYDAIGGAVWLEGAGSRLDMSGGEISGNSAKSSSGKNACAGIYVSGATFTMTGGKISGNNVLGGNSQGGALRLNGKFNISGSAYIPYGGAIGKNDVYLCDGKTVTIAGALSPPSGVTKVAAITPSVFKRGTNILDGTAVLLSQNKEKFSVSQDDADWNKVGENIAGQYFVRINSPVYVVGAEGTGSTKPEGFSWGQTTGATGTKGHPFASVSAALSVLEAGAINEITIAGLLKGAQAISGTFPSFTLNGYGGSSSAVINAGGASGAGSALTVDASGKTVTIQDLTITGGNATNGGGINIAAGTVKLDDGAKVTGNIASANGGGVYVGSSGTLFMCGSSLIGDSSDSTTIAQDGTAPGASTFANKAKLGGGIYNDGALYIGYSGMSGANPEKSAMTVTANSTAGYGIRRNLAESGAGVYQNSSTDVQVASGKISYNMATESGGAFYIAKKDSTTKTKVTFVQNSTAAMDSNKAAVSGGAVHIAGTFTVFSGNGHNNVAPQGGAIYQGEELNFGQDANFYDANNAKGINDIYVVKSIYLSAKANGGATVASITMPDDKWIRGKDVFQSAQATYTAASAGKFKATDSDFTVVQKNSTSATAVLSADIYVAGTASTRKHCLSTATPTDSATTRGTASSPFASIKGAMYAVNADATTITVDGTLSDAQTIDGKKSDGASIPTAVTAITVKGYKASSTATSSGMLDGGSNSSNKTMLTVNKSGLAVTIQDLTITRGNATNGGGINLAAGTVNLESGAKVSSNKVTNGGYGAGVYVASGATLNIKDGSAIFSNSAYSGTITGAGIFNSGTVNMSGGSVYSNTAYNGGAFYNGGTLSMTGGTIGDSGTLNSATNAGGAIYQAGTFNVSGDAFVYSGSEKSNDVYLASEKVVTINGNYNGAGNTASSQMALTPANWTRGSYVLGGASCSTTNAGYFKITDSEWEILKNNSTDKGRIDADIYVAPTSSTTTVNSVTYGKGAAATAGGRGTKAKPYSTIADAVAQCWGGPNDKGTGVSRTINIVGTISGAQEIASTVTTAKASGITLKGVANSTATLNGNMSSTSATKKSTLTISTAVPVTIQTLTVKGGYSSGNGGGILVNGVKGASLTLGTGAVITGNTATTSGGGIYFAGTSASGGTANLIMNSTSQISGNTASGTATTNGGGGVYLSYANLCMSGNALIGDTSGSTYATNASTGHSNMAKNGGGVYLAAGGKLRLGYASAGATGGTNLSSTYGIRHNYASACGGGVYAVGSVDFASGAVSCNGTAGTSDCDGGGIWFGSASTLTMTGGTIANNKGCYGGGVYAGGTLSMSGGTIGDSSKTTAATSSSGYYSNSASYGGGIYAPNGSTLTLNGGYVSYNYASSNGGGIYSVSSNAVTFKANANFNRAGSNGGGMYIKNQISMTGGVIKGNCAVSNGGGVYMDGGNLYMSGSAVIGDSSKSDYATSASSCSNYALNNGGGVYLGNESYAYLGYTNSTNPINSFAGGIYYNYAKNNGGGICDNPDYGNDVKFNGGSISFNGTSSSGFGGAVYLSGNSSTLTFRGSNTKIVAGSYSYYNTVYLNGAIVGVDASNSPTSTTIATIIPSSYSSDTKVMDYTSASSCAAKIKVWPTASDNWLVQNGGYIDKGSRVTSASDAAAAIQALSSGKSARIIIECSVSNASTFFSTIKAALVNSSACISLDLTGVTGLTEISNNAFYGGSDGCPSLYSIRLPSTITRIGTNAFANCTNLGKYYNGSLTTSSTQTVFLPESCTEVGAAAFYKCYFNRLDLDYVKTVYTSACVGWTGTENKTISLTTVNGGEPIDVYTGSGYTTVEHRTCSMGQTYESFLSAYGEDSKIVFTNR